MAEVKRYEFVDGELRERPPGWSGGMVFDHDYTALERERDELAAKSAECQCDRLGPETVECAQIVGEALAGPASLHIGHLPDMCRDLVAELTRLRAVEVAANADADRYRWLRDEAGNVDGESPLVCVVDNEGYQVDGQILVGAELDAVIDAALREACGRKG